MDTQFASPDRSPISDIKKDYIKIVSLEHIVEISEAINTIFLILNKNRQIIYANQEFLTLLDTNINVILGQRPGEILNCINATKLESGCGTYLFCKECGVLNTVLEALEGKNANNECRLSSTLNNKHVSYDLSVKARPFMFDNSNYALVSIVDIHDKKRKEILEMTFFHDILNTAGGMYGLSHLLKLKLEEANSEHYDTAEIICNISDKLIKEIKSQRMLIAAENNNLSLKIKKIKIYDFIKTEINLIKENSNTPSCDYLIFQDSEISLHTDPVLLQRIILNLLKNAAEASNSNNSIEIRISEENDFVLFQINNKTFIEEKIQHQIFQRSFSTRKFNRGIGTYSIKLFTENYLQGKVWFESNKENGTTFFLKLPKVFDVDA